MKNISHIILIAGLHIVSFSGFSQNLSWVNKDRVLIKKFTNTYLTDSSKLHDIFLPPDGNDTTFLGNGYYSVSRLKPGGYISVYGDFLYLNDTLINFKLNSKMPSHRNLWPKYKTWHSKIFNFKDTFELIPIYHNYEQWIQPFSEYDGDVNVLDLSPLFQKFMSIESGNIFGYYNGWYGLHTNREIFEELIPELNPDNIYLIMYSKNPVSRLQGFYYFLTHESEFDDVSKGKIASWMDVILEDPPEVSSAEGDFIGRYPVRERLMYYVNIDLEAMKKPPPKPCSYFGFGWYPLISSDNDSLSYECNCPLISLDFTLYDRYGTVVLHTTKISNPLDINLAERVVVDGKKIYKLKNDSYVWVASYTAISEEGEVQRQVSGNLAISR